MLNCTSLEMYEENGTHSCDEKHGTKNTKCSIIRLEEPNEQQRCCFVRSDSGARPQEKLFYLYVSDVDYNARPFKVVDVVVAWAGCMADAHKRRCK